MSKRAVECECREVLPVPEGATTSLRCSCGRSVIVSLVEEFDGRSVVLSAATLERRIRRLIAVEQLPPHRECAWCGSTHAEPLDVRLVCEQTRSRVTGGFRFLRIPGLFWMFWREEERVENFGRENTVPVPLCACEMCARHVREPLRSNPMLLLTVVGIIALSALVGYLSPITGALVAMLSLIGLSVGLGWRRFSTAARWQENLKSKLRQVSVYRQLLLEYPDAVVNLPSWVWAADSPRPPGSNAEV